MSDLTEIKKRTLLELTEAEYDILVSTHDSIKSITGDDRYTERFAENLRQSLLGVLYLHFDNNSLKKKYYTLKAKEKNE